MCANYEPISPNFIAKLGMPAPTFDYVKEAFPGDLCPILMSDEHSGIQWKQAVFGLIPAWCDGPSFARHTYNARTETIAEKPSYRTPWRRNQFALVPMQAFYEPEYVSGKPVRTRIERIDHEPFTCAAIWDLWSDHLNTFRSFSMLTINAKDHALMKRFHKPGDEKRSVVIVPEDLRKDWLNANHKTAQELIHEMTASQFTAIASPLVTKGKSKPMNLDLF